MKQEPNSRDLGISRLQAGEQVKEKQTKKRTFQPNRYCHNCLHNWGSVCERDGHKVAQYEWCRHWEERNEHVC